MGNYQLESRIIQIKLWNFLKIQSAFMKTNTVTE